VAGEDEYSTEAGPLLDSPKVALARAAVQGLACFPSARTIAILQRKLRQGPNALRFTAVDVLEAIGTAEVLKPLLDGSATASSSSGCARRGRWRPSRAGKLTWRAPWYGAAQPRGQHPAHGGQLAQSVQGRRPTCGPSCWATFATRTGGCGARGGR
jgi:hypothetical protein